MIPKKYRSHKGALLALLLVLTGSRVAAQSQRTKVLAHDRAMSDSSQATGLGRALAWGGSPDLLALYPGAPVVVGRPAVLQLLDAQPVLGSASVTWQPIAIEISPDSTLAATWGVAVVATNGTGPARIGRYLTVWERNGEAWLARAMLLPDMTADGTAIAVDGQPREVATISASASPFVQADVGFARLARDSGAAIAFERWAAADAQMWSGAGMLVQGPQAIGRLVSGPNSWRWEPVATGASKDGRLGWTAGQAVISTPDGHAGPSKYLTVWRRQVDGSVRYVSDGGNGRP